MPRRQLVVGFSRTNDQFPGLDVFRSTGLEQCITVSGKPHPAFYNNLLCNLVLDIEDVGDLSIVALGPQLSLVSGIYELGCNSHARAGAADTAGEDVSRIQLCGDAASFRVRSAISK